MCAATAGGMMMPGVQAMGQPPVQPVYAGVPAGFMPQPHWQQTMMCGPMPGHNPYMQHMQPQYAHMMPGQPMAGPMQVDPGHAYMAGAPQYAAPHGQTAMGMTPSTLPPLAADGGAGDVMDAGDYALVKSETTSHMGMGGLEGSFSGDMMDDAGVPEEMDDFLNILARDAPIDK